jgi:hypothetical protein
MLLPTAPESSSLGRVVANAPQSAAGLRLYANPIVHRSANPLFAAEITFGCLDRHVAEQELDLLQLSAGGMAQLRARAPQVMGRDGPEPQFGTVLLHDVPNQAFGHAVTPAFAGSAHAAE